MTRKPVVALIEPRPAVTEALRTLDVRCVAVRSEACEPDVHAETLHVRWDDPAEFERTVAAMAQVAPAVVLGFGETSVAVAAALAKRLGVAGPGADDVAITTDKWLFRRRLSESGLPAVAQRICDSAEALRAAVAELGTPLIVKPRSGVGSEGVQLLADPDEVDRLAHKLDYGQGHVVEEFLVGPEFSVESISRDGAHEILGVTRKSTSGPPGFVETGHVHPAPDGPYDELRRAAVDVLDAIGMTTGLAHTEFILTDGGPRVIESHARPGGDRITDLFRLATGRDMFVEVAAAHLGMPVQPSRQAARYAEIRFLSVPPGTVRAVTGLAEVAAFPWVHEISLPLAPGDPVRPVVSSATRPGFVVITGATPADLAERFDRIGELLLVDVV
ncbi:ATP-grasp domain-containing protein [Micromonospora sp. NPDC047074]|uniref:ATP-grasp domain-containing protein n=1 Tax=Micromonospora sp. NPDC047074 TaxID=3154339 RepID=UPI0033F6D096